MSIFAKTSITIYAKVFCDCMGNVLHYTCPPECSLQMKDDSDMNDNGTCSTTSAMTANPAYGTTRGLMANISHNTTANPWICERDESIVMHKNPTYVTAAKTVRLN